MKSIEIYWSDLTETKQQEILELFGDNGNYDVFPLAVIEYEETENSEINSSGAINKEKN